MKLCTVCGVITSRPGSRCGQHPRLSGIGANHHVHTDPRWTRLSKRMIARHVGRYGYVCPGDGPEHPAHPTRDLTLDHVLALIDGGAPFDPANTRVLCRSRNSANGARLVNARRADRGYPHAGSVLVEVRDASEGFWRRIALIPWAVRFAKRGESSDAPAEDPGLAAILAGEAPGILAWAVRGAVAYATAGTLHPFPAAVARETAAYRAEEDPLGGFLREWVVPQADAATPGPKVYEQYAIWAGLVGAKPMTAPVFGRAFTERHDRLGFPVRRRVVHGSPVYEGLIVQRPSE